MAGPHQLVDSLSLLLRHPAAQALRQEAVQQLIAGGIRDQSIQRLVSLLQLLPRQAWKPDEDMAEMLLGFAERESDCH